MTCSADRRFCRSAAVNRADPKKFGIEEDSLAPPPGKAADPHKTRVLRYRSFDFGQFQDPTAFEPASKRSTLLHRRKQTTGMTVCQWHSSRGGRHPH
jgi:hypothetical protein